MGPNGCRATRAGARTLAEVAPAFNFNGAGLSSSQQRIDFTLRAYALSGAAPIGADSGGPGAVDVLACRYEGVRVSESRS